MFLILFESMIQLDRRDHGDLIHAWVVSSLPSFLRSLARSNVGLVMGGRDYTTYFEIDIYMQQRRKEGRCLNICRIVAGCEGCLGV